MTTYADLSDRARMWIALLVAFLVALIVSLVLTGLTLAYDVHDCHTTGGHYTLDSHLTGTCRW